jgi:tetratricopeptide (TPR) repeat protein
LNQPFDAPSDSSVPNRLSNTQIANNPLSNTGTISPTATARPSLIPPELQSTLLNTLQQRMEKSSDVGKAMADLRLAHPQPANQTPGTPQTPVPGPPVEQGPVQVSSLATGIKAKGLHDLLANAENLMRDGKFDLAVQKYNQAQRVAPNNPLTVLGRAHAELAGGYYARAEQDLRTVFHNDPQILLAQFDLAALLPKERIEFLHKDLQGLTETDPKSERPWLLLAYLEYNTNHPASAEQDLNEADKRTVRGDWAIRLMRQNWALPSNAKTPKPGVKTPRTIPPAVPTTPATPPAPNLNK